MTIRYCFLLVVYLLQALGSIAQSVSNIRAEAVGNLVTIYYDLAGTLPGQFFQVSVFSSHNNMQDPLVYVRGDVGNQVSPGSNKIEWGAAKELFRFEGELTFKVQATLTFSPFALKAPAGEEVVYRRGRSYPFEWQGGLANEPLQLELYRDSLLNAIITRTANEGKYEWDIPLDVVPGQNYRVKVSSVTDPANYRFSDFFTIRRKIPTAFKIIPFGMAAAVGVVLIPKGGTESPEGITDLPGPPDKPTR